VSSGHVVTDGPRTIEVLTRVQRELGNKPGPAEFATEYLQASAVPGKPLG
jgi:hypothetical protein